MQQRVNYDQIAPFYDEPARDPVEDKNLQEYISERHLRQCLANVKVLDLGCGTGKQLQADRRVLPGAFFVGLDLFRGMLTVAQKRGREIAWVQADGVAVPFFSDEFDYVCNQFSYPHILQKERMAAEVFRILKPGGRFAVTNIDPWSMADWIVYRYFQAAFEMDARDFLPVEKFVSLMEEVGFIEINVKAKKKVTTIDLQEFYAYTLQRYRTSQLLAIPNGSYEAGLERLQIDLAHQNDQKNLIASEFCLVTFIGQKPISE